MCGIVVLVIATVTAFVVINAAEVMRPELAFLVSLGIGLVILIWSMSPRR